MNKDFDEIRAEREGSFSRRRQAEDANSGLWKHIAIGVWLGMAAAGATGLLFWAVVARVVLSGMQFQN